MTTLLTGGPIYGTSPATAVVFDGPTITWIGDERDAPSADQIVRLDGAAVLPAFVDAHVHLTQTGIALDGLDLTDAPSLATALDSVQRFAATRPGTVLLGTGWDETRWPERRPPTAAELDRAGNGAVVYLARVDHHSAVASSAALTGVPGVETMLGYNGDGLVALTAHHAVRRGAYGSIDAGQRIAAQRATRARAAALGIAALHEMGGPDIGGEQDFSAAMTLTAAEPGPHVVGYWGELGAVEKARELGAFGCGGDLFVDGSFGSHTAWLSQRYADQETTGHCWITSDEIAEHVVACTRAGVQTGFHAIGDAAIAAVVHGMCRAATTTGLDAVRMSSHRVEHAELVGDVADFAEFGLIASVQPAFDERWGGSDRMYVDRLGMGRAAQMNPLNAFAAAGVALAFGSDAPVTPLDPWGGVRAAVRHRTPEHSLTYQQAFAAHTAGGWRAAREPNVGVLSPGASATYAVWAISEVDAATGLPDLDAPEPTCVRTVVHGDVIFDRAGALA
jgi:predicted amidohydrolase YtcJ